MAVAAAHFLSLSLTYLRATIDASAMWRALCAQPAYEWAALSTLADAGTSPSAVGNVVIGPYLGNPSRPVAFIRYADGSDVERFATTGIDVRGSMMLTIEATAPAAYADNIADANMWWTNVLGRIVTEMKTAVETSPAGKLAIDRISLDAIGMSVPDERGGAWVEVADFVVRHQGEI